MDYWERYRAEFPVTRRWAYMNHAAVAPLSGRAAVAMQGLVEDLARHGAAHSRYWEETYEAVRRAAARLVGALPADVAIVKNTTEGLSFIANGLDWRPGDAMVGVAGEFPANYFPWENLRRRGVEVRSVPQRQGRIELDDLDRACRGARLLAVSWVQYLGGFRIDLDAVGEICLRHGCLFVLDAIQGLGVFPLDVRRARIHALAADGHKWLCGPEGCGFLYVDPALLPQLDVVELGWTSVLRWRDYQAYDPALRPGAARFECGTLTTVACYGLLGAIDLLLEVGINRIAERVPALTQRLACGVREKGYELLTDPNAGIVAFRKPGVDPVATVRRLAAQGIAIAPRSGWLRASPHFYVSEPEVDSLLAALE
jgi:selenocysteine lyase/cysteine desulfurase